MISNRPNHMKAFQATFTLNGEQDTPPPPFPNLSNTKKHTVLDTKFENYTRTSTNTNYGRIEQIKACKHLFGYSTEEKVGKLFPKIQ